MTSYALLNPFDSGAAASEPQRGGRARRWAVTAAVGATVSGVVSGTAFAGTSPSSAFAPSVASGATAQSGVRAAANWYAGDRSELVPDVRELTARFSSLGQDIAADVTRAVNAFSSGGSGPEGRRSNRSGSLDRLDVGGLVDSILSGVLDQGGGSKDRAARHVGTSVARIVASALDSAGDQVRTALENRTTATKAGNKTAKKTVSAPAVAKGQRSR